MSWTEFIAIYVYIYIATKANNQRLSVGQAGAEGQGSKVDKPQQSQDSICSDLKLIPIMRNPEIGVKTLESVYVKI